MSTYDTRMLSGLVILGFVLFKVGNIRIKEVSFVFSFMAFFLVVNTVMLYVFAPHHGSEIYGTYTVLFGYGRFSVTAEQLFYQLNYTLKFFATIPVVLLFVSTTNPSEFAASLNKIGIKYSVAYSVALALRYIPDIQAQYRDISQASQARGIEMSKKASVIERLKAASDILIPLILTSVDRIEVISNAMELRCFGKNKTRTWYMERPFTAADVTAMILCALLIALSTWLTCLNGGRYYNPFI